jgi:hypothetical protein
MQCPLCGSRKSRRSCPALGKDICPTCCGTKRLVEIPCPSDCGYLAVAREHPPAAVVRQQQQDMSRLMYAMRDLSDRQSRLLLLVAEEMLRFPNAGLEALTDVDAADAAGALAATYETAARGVIYEHRPSSLVAKRLVDALQPQLAEAARGLAGFDRDAAVVLRRLQEAATAPRASSDATRRSLLDLFGRVLIPRTDGKAAGGEQPSRLIVP